MSKKCIDHNKLCCERRSSRSSKSIGSSSNRKRSRSYRKSLQGLVSSSKSNKKSKRTRDTRTEHLIEFESSESESGTCRSKSKRRRKTKRKGVKRDKKRKKKRKTKKIDSSKKRKLSGSSACSRLIELLIKCCFCLKGLDSSSSSSPPYADTSCCCCAKCRFCKPDCDCKSIQCDDCDLPVKASLRATHDDHAGNLRNSRKKRRKDSTNRKVDGTLGCVTLDKSGIVCENRKKDYRLDFCKDEADEALNACTCNKKKRSNGEFKSSIVKSLTSLKDSKKCQSSAKSFIDENSILPNTTTVKLSKDCCTRDETPKIVSSKQQIFESNEQNPNNCTCTDDDRSKSTNALLIMCDIVFWPLTCFPKRPSLDNKNKKK